MIFFIPISIIDCINCNLSIHAYITCIVNDLGTLRVTQKIQIMSFLQDDK